VRQGEPGERFYLIESGAYEVLVDGQPIARLARGDFFGERALLRDAPRAATVVALGPGRLFWLDRGAFRAMVARDVETWSKLENALVQRAELAAIPLFRDLTPVQLDLLLTRLIPVRVQMGQAILRQGDPGDRFYIIRSGEVVVLRDGRVLTRLGPGNTFGEIALLRNTPRTASVRATVPCELLALEAADFHDLLLAYCERAGALERLSHLRLASHFGMGARVAAAG
jgi:CRP-like cAMP-binding protein